MIDQNKKYLVIVESPNKKGTIAGIFKDAGFKNVTVKASAGHITQIKDGGSYWNTGISPKDNFKINYQISPDKKKIVEELKAAVAKADRIFLCTDPDREGEAISWHLKKQLKIADKNYDRMTFHEITKSAVLKALDAPRKIDNDLVMAAQSRQVLDKITGYRLSPIARSAIGAKSVGRCQSAGLKLIVMREEEIINFKVEKYYDLFVHFDKNSTKFKAKYVGTKKKEVKRIETIDEVNAIKDLCKGKDFIVKDVQKKELKEYPKPPFNTSTFQQEANRVCGLSIDASASCAQKLFEGISVGGQHMGLITYIRTDDTTMSPEFAKILAAHVKGAFGAKYCGTLQTGKKSENAQEAHECIRVTNLSMTPTELAKYISDINLLKVYKLIYNRTLQAIMTPAVFNVTQYTIANGDQLFSMTSRELIFPGYRKVYTAEDSEDGEAVLESFETGEKLNNPELKEELKETTPPPRYNQGSFVKELEKQGIGRPSTYPAIIKTLVDESRGYCTMDKKNIVPTDKGIRLSHFLDEAFPDLININYTCELEKNLDLIANGKLNYLDFLNDFYTQLEASAGKAIPKPDPDADYGVCPNCGSKMALRRGKFGPFLGCSNYPKCKTIKSL